MNTYLYQIVSDLVANNQIAAQNHRYSIYREHSNVGDFRFCLLRKVISPETDIPGFDARVMELKYLIRRLCGSPAKWYGLESSNIIFEYVPLFSKAKQQHKLKRIEYAGAKPAGRIASASAGSAAATAPEDDEPEDIFSSAMKGEREKNLADATSALVGGDTASFKPLVIDEDDEDDSEE